MKTIGIVSEFNPMHNGHAYIIAKAKELTKADYCIAIMSGNHTQRGECAIIDKYMRTEFALRNGVDVCIELPVTYATSSATYFALGGVMTLDKLGVVDTLVFGSEQGIIEPFYKLAQSIIDFGDIKLHSLIKDKTKLGIPYPKARQMVVRNITDTYSDIDVSDMLGEPNNILGIEYVKSILECDSDMNAITIRREGAGYNSQEIINNQNNASAMSIRKVINNAKKEDIVKIQKLVPHSVYNVLERELGISYPVDGDDYMNILNYIVASNGEYDYSIYSDVSRSISDRIRRIMPISTSLEEAVNVIHSKEITKSYVRRALLHIILGLKDIERNEYMSEGVIGYARLLGFRRDSTKLLSEMKEQSVIPIIAKLADANKYLEPIWLRMLEEDIRASNIYSSIVANKYGILYKNEYIREIVRI